jgi:hypothetical protein
MTRHFQPGLSGLVLRANQDSECLELHIEKRCQLTTYRKQQHQPPIMMSANSPLLPPLHSTSSSGQQQPISSKFFIPSTNEQAVFTPHPSIAVGAKVAVTSAGVGLLVSSVQNALEK